MKINEHYAKLRKELNEIYEGATIGEYGCTECGGKTIRGPHITVMIPAEKELDPKGFDKVATLINDNLCDIEWDGKVHFGQCGGIYEGHYAELTMDKKDK